MPRYLLRHELVRQINIQEKNLNIAINMDIFAATSLFLGIDDMNSGFLFRPDFLFKYELDNQIGNQYLLMRCQLPESFH